MAEAGEKDVPNTVPTLNKEEAQALQPLMQEIYKSGRLLTGLVIDSVEMPIRYLTEADGDTYSLDKMYSEDGILHLRS